MKMLLSLKNFLCIIFMCDMMYTEGVLHVVQRIQEVFFL